MTHKFHYMFNNTKIRPSFSVNIIVELVIHCIEKGFITSDNKSLYFDAIISNPRLKSSDSAIANKLFSVSNILLFRGCREMLKFS